MIDLTPLPDPVAAQKRVAADFHGPVFLLNRRQAPRHDPFAGEPGVGNGTDYAPISKSVTSVVMPLT